MEISVQLRNPIWIYDEVRHWFHCCWNRKYRSLVKTALQSKPYDYCDLFRLEEAQIAQMLDFYETGRNAVDKAGTKRAVETMRVALKLLHIIINEDDLWEVSGDMKTSPCKDRPGFFQYDTSGVTVTYIGPRVNTRNARRFINVEPECVDKHLAARLYLAKAEHLYYLVRLRYIHTWWD